MKLEKSFLNAFKSGRFSLQPTEGTGSRDLLTCLAEVSSCLHLKILSPKQMLQRFPLALSWVKAGTTSENLLNEIPQIIIVCKNKYLKFIKQKLFEYIFSFSVLI